MNGQEAAQAPFVVLLPLYNDWEALRLLLIDLDRELATHGIRAGFWWWTTARPLDRQRDAARARFLPS